MSIKRHLTFKRALVATLAACFFGALAVAYFFFPVTAKDVLKSAAAVAVRSWDDTFGSPADGGYLSEIVLASSTAEAERAAAAEPSGEVNVLHDAPAGAQAGTSVPEVVLEVATTTTAAAASSTVGTDAAESGTPTSEASTADREPPPMACTISTSAALSRALIFNEIAWMGSPPLAGESALAASNREWVELKNISVGALDLSGWQLLDAAGNVKIVFGAGARVPAKGFLLLERGDDAVPSMAADVVYAGGLPNAGGVLAVVDGQCGASDILDASLGWPAGNKETKQTLERDADGIGWHTSISPGGTPKAENSVAVMPVASSTTTAASATSMSSNAGVVIVIATTTAITTTTTTTTNCIPLVNHLVIAEVQIAGAASNNDFVKLFNPTAETVDMSGWKLRKKSKSGADYSLRVLPDASMIAAGGYFTWANADDGFGDAIGANVTSTATLAADNSVALLDAGGAVLDAVAWGEGTDQYAEGAAYPANPEASQVLKRKLVNGTIIDTDNNTADFIF